MITRENFLQFKELFETFAKEQYLSLSRKKDRGEILTKSEADLLALVLKMFPDIADSYVKKVSGTVTIMAEYEVRGNLPSLAKDWHLDEWINDRLSLHDSYGEIRLESDDERIELDLVSTYINDVEVQYDEDDD